MERCATPNPRFETFGCQLRSAYVLRPLPRPMFRESDDTLPVVTYRSTMYRVPISAGTEFLGGEDPESHESYENEEFLHAVNGSRPALSF